MARPARHSFLDRFRTYPGALIPVEDPNDIADFHYLREDPVKIFWEEILMANGPDPYKIKKSLEIKPEDDQLVRQLKASLRVESEWYFMADNTENEAQPQTLVEPAKLVITRSAFDKLKAEDDSRVHLLEKIKRKALRVEWGEKGQYSSSPVEVVWYFDPQVYLALIKDYPWLLDKNLGCKQEPDYTFGFKTGAPKWTP